MANQNNKKLDEKVKIKGTRCRICYLATMDPDVREILANPDATMKKKHDEISDLHQNWTINYGSVRNHIVQDHATTRMMSDISDSPEGVVESKDVMAWMMRRGLEGLKRRKRHDDIDAKTLIELRKLELEERKLDIAEKGGANIGEFARLMNEAQYGAKKNDNGSEGTDKGTN